MSAVFLSSLSTGLFLYSSTAWMSSVATSASASSAARSLYTRILRAARAMPTSNRRAFVCKKARDEFEAARKTTDREQLLLLFAYGETSLDNIEAIAAHLRHTDLSHEFDPLVQRKLMTNAREGKGWRDRRGSLM